MVSSASRIKTEYPEMPSIQILKVSSSNSFKEAPKIRSKKLPNEDQAGDLEDTWVVRCFLEQTKKP